MGDAVRAAILDRFPAGARLVSVTSYRPGYLPYPARVLVEADGVETVCVVKVGAPERIDREARTLRALAELGLPVPAVLSAAADVLLLSELPGEPLPWLALTDLNAAHRTCQLAIEAVDRLHGLTEAMERRVSLPRRTLAGELAEVVAADGPWRMTPLVAETIARLEARSPLSTRHWSSPTATTTRSTSSRSTARWRAGSTSSTPASRTR